MKRRTSDAGGRKSVLLGAIPVPAFPPDEPAPPHWRGYRVLRPSALQTSADCSLLKGKRYFVSRLRGPYHWELNRYDHDADADLFSPLQPVTIRHEKDWQPKHGPLCIEMRADAPVPKWRVRAGYLPYDLATLLRELEPDARKFEAIVLAEHMHKGWDRMAIEVLGAVKGSVEYEVK